MDNCLVYLIGKQAASVVTLTEVHVTSSNQFGKERKNSKKYIKSLQASKVLNDGLFVFRTSPTTVLYINS